jgi:WD40 repeat protein
MDNTLRLWDLETGQTVRTFKGHNNSVTAVALTPDGCRLVASLRRSASGISRTARSHCPRL